MAGVNVKMGVSGVSQFKRDINDVKNSIRTMDADLELIEKSFRATGDAQTYMQEKAEVLNGKLAAQESVLRTAEAALKAMMDNGVSPASAAFQNMQREIISAKSSIIDTKTEIAAMGKDADGAGQKAGTLNDRLKSIGRDVSFQNVTTGLKTITDTLEKGAKAAVNLGKKIIRSSMDSSGWADEVLTEATKYGVDAETIQRMRNVSDFIDTEVETILNAKARLAKNSGSLGDLLGFTADGMSIDDAFWKAGEAIMRMADEFEQEDVAQKIFGKSWKDLLPLFTAGQEEYNQKLAEQNVLSNEQVQNLGKVDDAFKSIQQQIDLMKNQFWADNADKITGLLQWMIDNQTEVVGAVTAMAGAFGAFKIAEFATNLGKVVTGFQTLWSGAKNPLPNITVPASGAGQQAAGAASAAAGTAGKATAVTGSGAGGFWALMATLMGLSDEDAKELGNYRRENPEKLVGSEANFAARVGENAALEQAFIQYMQAQVAAENDPFNDSKVDAFIAAQEKFNKMNGSQEMMDAYFDWLQTNSKQMGDLPQSLQDLTGSMDRMNQAAEDFTGGAAEKVAGAGKDISNAAAAMESLPARVASAIRTALGNISINIDGQRAGNILTPAINTGLGAELLRFFRP